ncbi:MAG: hypothetical protein HOY44_10080 [Maritimibacter sp.]|uniref:hypothetical protein n=1 Tax=Maritimibacter sp. TaxID=2003363 RepID=UPI001D670F2F|nr:hypothetical protein [Maritimibacter sp.]MBL6427861.1 hypothetical protein [Maritimibacter sp.]
MKKTEQRHKETRERLTQFEKQAGVKAPENIWDDEGGFTDEILAFAVANGLSLDWLFLGDPMPTILTLHRRTIAQGAA